MFSLTSRLSITMLDFTICKKTTCARYTFPVLDCGCVSPLQCIMFHTFIRSHWWRFSFTILNRLTLAFSRWKENTSKIFLNLSCFCMYFGSFLLVSIGDFSTAASMHCAFHFLFHMAAWFAEDAFLQIYSLSWQTITPVPFSRRPLGHHQRFC